MLTPYQKDVLGCTKFNETDVDWILMNEELSLVSTEAEDGFTVGVKAAVAPPC